MCGNSSSLGLTWVSTLHARSSLSLPFPGCDQENLHNCLSGPKNSDYNQNFENHYINFMNLRISSQVLL